MKIVSLSAENFMRLKAVSIKPDGTVVQITGKNGAGKSSVLNAIYGALAGADRLPSQPIRKGADKAVIKLDLGEFVVTRRFTEKGTTVTIEQPNGARFQKPQQMLDSLIGAITLDPVAWLRLKPAEQYDAVSRLVGIDFSALDAADRTDYDERTEINRQARQLRAQAAGIVVPEGTPDEPVDTSELMAQMREASATNEAAQVEQARRQRLSADINAAKLQADAIHQQQLSKGADIERLRKQIFALEEQIEQHKVEEVSLRDYADRATRDLDALPAIERVDLKGISDKLPAAQAVNRQVEQKRRRAELDQQAAVAEQQAEMLTKLLDGRKEQRAKAIGEAQMPVPGLSLGAGELLLNGLPLDQASDAERLRLAMAIAMSEKPKLRVLRIREGSLLDDDSMKVIEEMCAADDWQVWIERVQRGAPTGILIEDGEAIDLTDIPEQSLENAMLAKPGEGRLI